MLQTSRRRVFGFLHIFEVFQNQHGKGWAGENRERWTAKGKAESRACKQIKRLLLGRRPSKALSLKAEQMARTEQKSRWNRPVGGVTSLLKIWKGRF